ncbi:unnamed protein product [Durusdinium trenchii]|uniref:Uncharacterized protein n=1 Tax=Durusdinium trenchii TaxID=1381693 RepID=A0ABP0K6D6_9DINO
MAPPPGPGDPQEATSGDELRESRKARMEALCAKLTMKAKKAHQERADERDRTTERWSGLRIVDRCIRQEKWDASMRGKDLVPIQHLGGLSAPEGLLPCARGPSAGPFR